jgi:mono/diheme cytochrome c family protein
MIRPRLHDGLALLFAPMLACAAEPVAHTSSGSDTASETDTGVEPEPEPIAVSCDLPVIHASAPASAAAGEAALIDEVLGGPLVPLQAMRNLSLVWGVGLINDDELYWRQFRERYGFLAATWDNHGLPVGIQRFDAQQLTFNCLMCHAGAVNGELWLGLGNTQLDIQGLHDDLVALAVIAENYGFAVPPLPWSLEERTGAAGLTDAFGMGMQFATAAAPGGEGLATRYGYQDPGAWWLVKHSARLYCDGAGNALGHRTMMAMLLAFGMPFAQLIALDETIENLRHYVLSIERPTWPGPPLDHQARIRGRLIFDDQCATCHGVHSGDEAAYPNAVVDLEWVGTDPERTAQFAADEAAWINAGWFAQDHPMEATHGYLAPPLAGVWATAPYLHNGSIPTLRALLVPAERPVAWRQIGRPDEPGSWDFEAVGVRWQAVDGPANAGATLEERRIHDARRPHLDNSGHEFGAGLDEEQLQDLLEYLKGL